MLASTKTPVFRISGTSPLAKMEDLWRFARFVAQIMGHEISVEGVEFASAGADGSVTLKVKSLREGDSTGTLDIAPPPRHFHFKRAHGPVMQADLMAYAAFLRREMSRISWKSSGLAMSRRTALGTHHLRLK